MKLNTSSCYRLKELFFSQILSIFVENSSVFVNLLSSNDIYYNILLIKYYLKETRNMAESFKLPASSFEEILKIIQAYANEKEGVSLSLDDISQSTGVPRTVVSANNGFFVQIGLITEGNKKSATDIGRSLGRAYISKIDDEIERIWKEVVAENDFLNRMISAVRIRNGMDRSSFLNHIIYSSGQKDTKRPKIQLPVLK